MKRAFLSLVVVVGSFGCGAPLSAPRRAASPSALRPPACTAALLARTPPYDRSRFHELIGHYRWTSIDTVSTRPALSREDRERMKKGGRRLPSEFRLWPTDSVLRVAESPRPGELRHRPIGPLSGALVDGDTAGFSPDHPQVEVTSETRPFLEILYDPGVGRGLMDGGHVMEVLPIQVLGDWGFGGYYDTRGDLIAVRDRNGKLMPSFAGYYCAFRL